MKSIKTKLAFALIAISSISHANNDDNGSASDDIIMRPDRASMGNGYFQTFLKIKSDGSPKAIGIKFPKQTLSNLPHDIVHDGSTCLDLDNNNEIDLHEECVGGHSRILRFNSTLTPFKNIVINWENHGHVPPGVYDIPHFDFHFYMISDIERKMILPGHCFGLMNCELTEKAIQPIPDDYIHPDYVNTELAFAHMGNHYVDSTSPELNDGLFTQTFIFGSFDGDITFYEPMVSRDFLLSKPSMCAPIKQPLLFQTSGFYPTEYCVRYNANTEMYRVSLESFTYQVGE